MLRGIDPLLTGELLKHLDEMGHGDTLLLVDRNYPASASGRPVIRLGEVTVQRAAEAILGVLPLDSFVEHPLGRMEVNGDPSLVTPTQAAVLEIARRLDEPTLGFAVIPRLEFYEAAQSAFVIVHTLDATPYSCFALQKGVIMDDGAAVAGAVQPG